MTPMIDIVFLLIIFFMTVSQITKVVDLNVDLPAVSKGGEDTRQVTITINLDEGGRTYVAGRQVTGDDLTACTISQIADHHVAQDHTDPRTNTSTSPLPADIVATAA